MGKCDNSIIVVYRNKTRQPSQTVQKEWIVTDDIDFNVLRKFRLTNVPNEDLPGESYGTTAFYNHKFDHLSTRKETPLVPQKGVVYNKDGTLEDPVMEKLIKDGAGMMLHGLNLWVFLSI